MTESSKYDRVEITEAGKVTRRLSRQEFQALPLDQRVKVVIDGRARFYQGNAEIPSRDALRTY